jgi:hypothetical protein
MDNSRVYLTIRIAEDGVIESIETRGGISIPESERSLIEEPLDLGNKHIGEFRTITLIKLIAPDRSYTWLVKAPLEYCRTKSCRYYELDESLWIKPSQEC